MTGNVFPNSTLSKPLRFTEPTGVKVWEPFGELLAGVTVIIAAREIIFETIK